MFLPGARARVFGESFVTKSLHGIDFGCAKGREEARQQRDGGQEQKGADKDDRIAGPNFNGSSSCHYS